MAVHTIDARGLKCPQPTLKLSAMVAKAKTGDLVEITADCPTFEKDVKDWCTRTKRTLLWIKDIGGAKKCQIQF